MTFVAIAVLALLLSVGGVRPGMVHALTLNELQSYQLQFQMIHEEVALGLAPGTLRKAPLNEEEKNRRITETAKFLMISASDAPVRHLEHWVTFYRNLTERSAREVKVSDPVLSDWHRKLVSGYRDCFLITSSALAILQQADNPSLSQVAADERISPRVRQNASRFHGLEKELRQIVRPVIENEQELRAFMTNMPFQLYIEHTWK